MPPEKLAETASTGPRGRFFGFSPQIAQKRLSPQSPPLQATRHLPASRRVINDPNSGPERPKCVKTIWKHHKYPPKVSLNIFGNFFPGGFSRQSPQKRLSPQPPPPGRLLALPPARVRTGILDITWAQRLKIRFLWLIGCRITMRNY